MFLTMYSVLHAQTRDGNFWIPNNSVYSMIVDDSRGIVLLGGSFDYIGPYAGGSLMLDKSTGEYDQTYPVVNGNVYASVSDGSGGIFIGGSFTTVGGVSRNYLAHITSSGTVSNWNPNPNGSVNALAVDNGIVYVGGSFTVIDGQSDSCLSSFDVATKTYNPSFQPDRIVGNSFSNVHSLCVYGGKLYVAGSFDSIGVVARQRIAAVDKNTGVIDSWNPSPTHWSDENALSVVAMAAYNGTLIVAGNFTTIGGVNRRSIAKVDTVTGSGASWDADIDPYIISGFFGADTTSSVRALYVKGDTLYAGGSFQGFQNQISYGVAAVNASTGSFIPNAVPLMGSNSAASFFSLDGTTLYIGGNYATIGGQQRKNLSAVNTTTGAVLSWNPAVSDEVNTIISSGTKTYIGGGFYSANGVVRYGLAALDQSTGVATNWDPNNGTTDTETTINVLSLIDTVLYVGGRFNNFASQSRTSLAAVGIDGGALLPFNPDITKYQMFSGATQPEVFGLAHNAYRLYVAGSLDTIDGAERFGAAAFALSDGSLTSWNPHLTISGEAGNVAAIAVVGKKVFLGGASFDMAGDSSRNNIAAVDTGTAAVLSWYPGMASSNENIYTMAVDGSTLYVGGSFSQIGGTARNNIAAFDTSSSTPTSWNPDLDSSPDAISISPAEVYLGGFFQTVGGITRYSIAAVDKVTGAATSWDPLVDEGNFVEAIAISTSNQKVYFGGGFNTVLGDFSQNFGAVTNPFDASLPVELTSFAAVMAANSVQLSWATATETNTYGFEVERRAISDQHLQGDSHFTWSKVGFIEGSGTTNTPKQYSFSDKTLATGKYSYRLKQIDRDGKFTYSQEVEATVGNLPIVFALNQNYPNPFNPSTTISYQIPENSYVSLKVYDIIGREVAALVSEIKKAGQHTATFDAAQLSSGIYIARLESGHHVQLRRMVLIK